jgi:hypothetical protein
VSVLRFTKNPELIAENDVRGGDEEVVFVDPQ